MKNADKSPMNQLQRVLFYLECAESDIIWALQHLAEVRAEAEALAGLDPEDLKAETDAIWREVRQMEDKLAAALRRAEKKKAELGNSLGNALSALNRT